MCIRDSCDPVAGLVEVPCIKRNVVGAVNAVSCANLALAGVDYAIPCADVYKRQPLGFGDWRVSTALITGFMAKESVVSTLTRCV